MLSDLSIQVLLKRPEITCGSFTSMTMYPVNITMNYYLGPKTSASHTILKKSPPCPPKHTHIKDHKDLTHLKKTWLKWFYIFSVLEHAIIKNS